MYARGCRRRIHQQTGWIFCRRNHRSPRSGPEVENASLFSRSSITTAIGGESPAGRGESLYPAFPRTVFETIGKKDTWLRSRPAGVRQGCHERREDSQSSPCDFHIASKLSRTVAHDNPDQREVPVPSASSTAPALLQEREESGEPVPHRIPRQRTGRSGIASVET
jgi:hypothetical protein